MKILALDPSSSCVGYAVLTGLDPADLVDGGRITPSKAKGVTAHLPDWLQDHLRSRAAGLGTLTGILSLCSEVRGLIDEHQPDRVVIEIPSGKAGTASKKQGSGGALGSLGLAAGAVLMAAADHHPDGQAAVVPVSERHWTPRPRKGADAVSCGGRGPKWQHQAAMAALYGGPDGYDPKQDPGADLADAIGLGRWWLGRMSDG
jgi:Holliday junction resolvasome RuvABC endonuclease subunit